MALPLASALPLVEEGDSENSQFDTVGSNENILAVCILDDFSCGVKYWVRGFGLNHNGNLIFWG